VRYTSESSCIYLMKHNSAGNAQWFKAGIVCRGNHEINSIEYKATHQLKALLGHICLKLTLAAKYDLEIHQMDIFMAVLAVDLEEEMCMHPPQGYILLPQNGS